jgi:hypothetical protein
LAGGGFVELGSKDIWLRLSLPRLWMATELHRPGCFIALIAVGWRNGEFKTPEEEIDLELETAGRCHTLALAHT